VFGSSGRVAGAIGSCRPPSRALGARAPSDTRYRQDAHGGRATRAQSQIWGVMAAPGSTKLKCLAFGLSRTVDHARF
jgi:hypothetical protein